MIVINCVCGHRLSATDQDGLFRLIRSHSDEAHPDQALTADFIDEMLQRSGSSWDGGMVRLQRPPEVKALEPGRADDFFRFFDHDAFADNPAWSSCYCMYYQVAETEDWEARTAAHNRADKAALIRAGRAHGFLAYAGAKPIGWCHAAPRLELPGLDRSEGMRDLGLQIAEAYPPRETLSEARSYHGPLEMYLKAGFEMQREAGHWLVVRKQLR